MRKREADLEHGDLKSLLPGFCIPALLSSLVTSVYNLVDQFFIGNTVGLLGNAATNVVFPAVTLLTAFSLMCGVGASAVMNLALGRGKTEMAGKTVGNAVLLMLLCGFFPGIFMLLWTEPILYLFGATPAVLSFAVPYARITALGYMFAVSGAAGPFLIRADRRPGYALFCTGIGCVLNVFLDALFILVFKWGIKGAAAATVIGQAASAFVFFSYLPRFNMISICREDFILDIRLMGKIMALGTGPMINFLTQAAVQVFLNGALRSAGEASIYGSETVLAVAGIANKVNTIASGIVTGLANGMQPIVSYNYGRKNYRRVAGTGELVIGMVLAVSFVIGFFYQLMPRQITALFGTGDEIYFEFAEYYFRIFLMLIGVSGLLSAVGGFFSAQGKPWQSIILSVVKQGVAFPVLLIVLPGQFGLFGILWSGPAADGIMAVLAMWLFIRQIRWLKEAEAAKNIDTSGI